MPAALVLVAVTMVIFVLFARLTVPLGRVVLVLVLVAGQGGDLLQLP